MKIDQTVPELPVPDVKDAQHYYRDRLGFVVHWYHDEGRIGAVSHGDCAIFFRASDKAPAPATFWIYTEDVDAAFDDLTSRGADVLGPPEDTTWGMRQFTVTDPYGNRFYFHHDL